MPDMPPALITGASSGIGLAMARLLARRGHDVLLAARREGPLKDAADQLQADTGARVIPIQADLATPQGAADLMDRVRQTLAGQPLSILVNNAGSAPLKPIPETTPDVMADTFGVNVLGPAELMRLVLIDFEAHTQSQDPPDGSQRGSIVNISSYASADPFPGFFAYAAAKAATNLMTRVLDEEARPLGLRAYCVAPAAVETPMLRSLFDHDQVTPDTCLAPGDVAQLILDCIAGHRTDDAGHTLFIRRADDGGVRIARDAL
jgi:NAD(P)-dependent dehydrogenase (short-subunit alcohol dehydrogenase family)